MLFSQVTRFVLGFGLLHDFYDRGLSEKFRNLACLPRGTILLNSTSLCAQAMRRARGLHKPQALSEHDRDLHTKRFVSALSVHWHFLVPSTMKIATSKGLLRWLAGWLATVLGRSAAS